MKAALSILALSALVGCGGGGGGSGGGFMPVAAPAESHPADPVAEAPMIPLSPLQAKCVEAAFNHLACELVPSDEPIGVTVPALSFASFTNNTGTYLQIDEIEAFTGERRFWSEYCVYLGDITNLTTAQEPAGKGEVNCVAKNIGEDYVPIRWGSGTGLSVAPGEMVMLNSHTEPAATAHVYSLKVSVQATGIYSWRQPQSDRVIPCNDEQQATDMVPWRNNTERDLHLIGASVYVETPSSKTPNTIGNACIYVLTADGSQKYANCDSAIRSKGEVSFPLVTIAPGEYVGAQATNTCKSGSHWNWAAWLRVW